MQQAGNEKLKESFPGKPVFAELEGGGSWDYGVLSNADTVAVDFDPFLVRLNIGKFRAFFFDRKYAAELWTGAQRSVGMHMHMNLSQRPDL